MNTYQYLEIILTVIAVLVLPALGLMIRSAVHSGRLETKLDNVIDDVRQLVASKDEVHKEMYAQMREDRVSTNKRLAWLEQNLWRRDKGGN